MFLSYSYLYTTSILHPSYLLNPTNLSNLSTQPYLNLCPFLLKNYPRYVPLYAYRGFESSGQIYFHFMKSSILKTFTTSLSRYQHNTLHVPFDRNVIQIRKIGESRKGLPPLMRRGSKKDVNFFRHCRLSGMLTNRHFRFLFRLFILSIKCRTRQLRS